MTVFCYKCCFWFSLRLGSILCAVLSILKAVCMLTVSIVLFKQDVTKGHIGKVLLSVFNESIVDFATREMLVIFILTTICNGVYILSCISLIIGAVLCKPKLCYPYLVGHFLWVLLDIMNYVILFRYLMSLTFLSAEELHTSLFGLGHVIVYLTIALLHIYYEAYLGLCVYSFTQLVKILRKELTEKKFEPVIKLIFKSGHIEEIKEQKSGDHYF